MAKDKKGTGAKQRRPNFKDAEQEKAFDSLTKADWADVYTSLFAVALANSLPGLGTTDPYAHALNVRNKLRPEAAASHKSGASKSSAKDAGGRLLTHNQYVNLTAVSAHADGMPVALYENTPDEYRQAFGSRGLVEVKEGRVRITALGDKALDRYEQTIKTRSAAANAPLVDAQTGGATGGTPTPAAGETAPTPIPEDEPPAQYPIDAPPNAPPNPNPGDVPPPQTATIDDQP